MVEVRAAVESDIPFLVELGRAFHQESPRYRGLSYSPEKVAAMIRQNTESTLACPAIGGALVAEKDGKIVGMMGGFVMEPWFSADKIATDYGLYVVPEHRSSRVALMLVRAFEDWAVAQGVVEMAPGVSSDIDAERTMSFYEKMGYTRYRHATMVKRFDNGR